MHIGNPITLVNTITLIYFRVLLHKCFIRIVHQHCPAISIIYSRYYMPGCSGAGVERKCFKPNIVSYKTLGTSLALLV